MPTKEQIVAEHKRLKAEYAELFNLVVEILCKHDPIGIAYEDNPHEYEPEARTILPRLRMCHNSDDVITVAHEEFQAWFGPDVAGDRESYRSIGEDIWNSTRESQLLLPFNAEAAEIRRYADTQRKLFQFKTPP